MTTVSSPKAPSEKRRDIVVAGHICLDITPRFGDDAGADFVGLFKPGKLIEVGEAVISTGGAVSNTGLALRKLGLDTVLMAKLNDDDLGRIVLGLAGAHEGMTVVSGEQTSYSVVLNPPGIDRMFLHCPGCNDTFSSHDINYGLCSSASMFHFGYPTLMRRFYSDGGRELTAMFQRIHGSDTVTSLDMTLPDPNSDSGRADWEAILRDTLPYVDIFMPSIEEALFMLMRPRYEELTSQAAGSRMIDLLTGEDLSALSERILALGARIAVIKVSHRGCYLRTAGHAKIAACSGLRRLDDEWAARELWQPCYRAPFIASGTGAGDAFIAGFLAAFARGKGPGDCLKYGSALGWQNVQAYDAVSGTRTWGETEKDVARDMETLPLDLSAAGWSCSTEQRIWRGPSDRT